MWRCVRCGMTTNIANGAGSGACPKGAGRKGAEAHVWDGAMNPPPQPPGPIRTGRYVDPPDPKANFHNLIPPQSSGSREHEFDVFNLMNGLRDVLEHYTSDKETLARTPHRFVAALEEMLSGYEDDPKAILSKTFEDPCDEMVILRGVPYTSLCEHHLLVFSGTVDIGYVPGKVVGLSKLARLVDCYSRRLQIQERMTRQIATDLMTHLDAKGAAVVVRGEHSCVSCRGVKKAGAVMVTSCTLGCFRDDAMARNEFLSLCQH